MVPASFPTSAIYKIDRLSGTGSILSSGSVGSGPLFGFHSAETDIYGPMGLAIVPNGSAVADWAQR